MKNWPYIYFIIIALQKYLFGLVVTAYVISAVGIPVYKHYCGGELEKINYVVKSNSCCGGEENDAAKDKDGCCTDENVILKSNLDFTIKHSDFELAKTISQVFCLDLPYAPLSLTPTYFQLQADRYPPPQTLLQQEFEVSTSVLRI